MRDRSIDILKGLAILFVYLGHSILYHPIPMQSMYVWCNQLAGFITSFNMPLFFFISGYLFAKTQKRTKESYKGKTKRILIPYITTMAILIGVKLFLPTSMSYNPATKGGIGSLIINALCYGGDRWFVYVLYVIFLFLIPLYKPLKNKPFALGIVAGLIVIYFIGFLPEIFKLKEVFYYMIFFIVGFSINGYYYRIKQWSLSHWSFLYFVFIVANLLFIQTLKNIPWVYHLILPFSGSIAVATMAFQLEKVTKNNTIIKYIEYCGKYSLQFYLLTFSYPIIRVVIVSVLHVSNPILIILSVFMLQLVSTTIIVEITRRIKWLKIPFGY